MGVIRDQGSEIRFGSRDKKTPDPGFEYVTLFFKQIQKMHITCLQSNLQIFEICHVRFCDFSRGAQHRVQLFPQLLLALRVRCQVVEQE
jgi:hypothetical protein